MSVMRNSYTPARTLNVIGQRLKLEMKTRGVTSTELAALADVKTSFIYDVISGKSTNPSTVKLARVAEGLGITLASLVNPHLKAAAPYGAKAPSPLHSNDYVAIPYLAIDELDSREKAMGHDPENQPVCFLHSWITKNLRSAPVNLRVFIISGDSMEPTLCHNDLVLVDTVNKNPTQPGVFVLFDGYGLAAKRVERVMNAASPRIRILSDNPQYSIYERSPSEAGIIGRVVWFSRRI